MTGTARIHDRGYTRYGGDRTGVPGAIGSLYRQTLAQAMGIRRSAWAKVVPFLTMVMAYLPGVAFVGIAALANSQPRAEQIRQVLPTYAEYYGFVWAAILVFVAFVAPELLCADRRSGMLGIYLASPLTRATYLVARSAGVLSLLALVTLGPPLLMLVANTLNDAGPDGFGAFVGTLGRVLVSGVLVAAFYGSLSLAVASLTTRRAFATVGVIFALIGSSIATRILIRGARLPNELFLADLLFLPYEAVFRIFGEAGHITRTALGTSTFAVAAACVAWIVVFSCTVWARYRRLEVTK